MGKQLHPQCCKLGANGPKELPIFKGNLRFYMSDTREKIIAHAPPLKYSRDEGGLSISGE